MQASSQKCKISEPKLISLVKSMTFYNTQNEDKTPSKAFTARLD